MQLYTYMAMHLRYVKKGALFYGMGHKVVREGLEDSTCETQAEYMV